MKPLADLYGGIRGAYISRVRKRPTEVGRVVGANLDAAMRSSRVTQEELASRIGVGQGKISLWKNGVNVPDAPNVAALAAALGVTADALLAGLAVREKNGNIRVIRNRAPGEVRAAKAARAHSA